MSTVQWEERLRGWEVLRQTISLIGRVAEPKTGKGIGGVEIVVASSESRKTGKSNMDGRFNFCDLPDGEYDLTVTSPVLFGSQNILIEASGFMEKNGHVEPRPEKDHRSAHIELTESQYMVKVFTMHIGS